MSAGQSDAEQVALAELEDLEAKLRAQIAAHAQVDALAEAEHAAIDAAAVYREHGRRGSDSGERV